MLSKWDGRYLDLAQFVSKFSKDPSTKVGAFIADGKDDISFGYNGFPSSIEDKPEWYNDRETKYKLVIHAEMNALLKAARLGRSVVGTTLYTYPLPPCPECAKMIVASGISKVISRIKYDKTSSIRYTVAKDTEDIFNKGGVEYVWVY